MEHLRKPNTMREWEDRKGRDQNKKKGAEINKSGGLKCKMSVTVSETERERERTP